MTFNLTSVVLIKPHDIADEIKKKKKAHRKSASIHEEKKEVNLYPFNIWKEMYGPTGGG